MKILLVGGQSSISKVIKKKFEQSHQIITAGKKNCDIYCDILDPNFNKFENYDLIINTAAHFGGSSFEEIIECEMTNTIGTLNVCKIAYNTNVKHYIYISSIYSTLDTSSRYYNIYSIAKKHAEDLVNFFCIKNKISYSILRPGPLYGNNDNLKTHHPFLHKVISDIKKDKEIIYFEENSKKNYIHIDDLAETIIRTGLKKVTGTFNCTHPKDTSYLEIAEAAIKAFNSKSKISVSSNTTNLYDNNFTFDSTLYDKIKFYPKISIETGIKKMAI